MRMMMLCYEVGESDIVTFKLTTALFVMIMYLNAAQCRSNLQNIPLYFFIKQNSYLNGTDFGRESRFCRLDATMFGMVKDITQQNQLHNLTRFMRLAKSQYCNKNTWLPRV